MEQEIRYKGLSLTPDETAAENGTLALCGNAELHDGALRPSVIKGSDVLHPLTITKTISGVDETKVCKLVHVHQTPSYTHFIAICPAFSNEQHSTMHWFDDGGTHAGQGSETNGLIDFGQQGGVDIVQVESIGNTLVILADNGIHYAIWKPGSDPDTGVYKYLGQKPPFVQLEFCMREIDPLSYDRSTVEGLSHPIFVAYRRTSIDADTENFETTETEGTVTGGEFKTEEVRYDITQEAWALINQTHDFITKKGMFYSNFVVRYCYRLYDGSMFMHSAPVLMLVGLPKTVNVGFVNLNSQGLYQDSVTINHYPGETTSQGKMLLNYIPAASYLMFKCAYTSLQNFADLKEDWADIVMSIDIFISPQFLKVEDSSSVQSVSQYKYSHGVFYNTTNNTEEFVGLGNTTYPGEEASFKLDIPEISDDTYHKRIRDNAVFYKIKSLNLEDTNSGSYVYYNKLDLSDVLPVLTSQEAMTDDYKSHAIQYPLTRGGKIMSKLYVYNHRLHFSAIRERLFEGFLFRGGLSNPLGGASSVTLDSIYYTINTAEGKKYVRKVESREISVFCLGHCLFFYPDSRAVKATVNFDANNNSYHLDIPLEPCLSLNGAMAQKDLQLIYTSDLVSISAADFFTPDIDDMVASPNTIYTSEPANPFIFPPSSIYTVGTGTILGMAANTRAISQGQFGQFPLMVMATDGIYALDVSGTGTYSSQHPISREVCSNPDAICQIDQQVILATTRGLSVVTEQNVASITDMLNGISKDVSAIAPSLSDYFAATSGDSTDKAARKATIRALLAFASSPIQYFQTAKVVYDFTCNRLLVYTEPTTAQISAGAQPIFVYSIKDGTWSTMVTQPILTAVNGYPYPYVQRTNGKVTRLNLAYPFDNTDNIPTIIVTRALSFGDAMFAINDIAHVKMTGSRTMLFLFGSNDLVNWHYVGRTNERHAYYLPTRSYRYYRLALYNVMKPSEQYMSTAFNVKVKYPKL